MPTTEGADPVVRRRFVVRGRVQGVFYRAACREQAVALGVAGWARNLADGSVEVVAEGGTDAVERLARWCRVGPPSALVTGVTSTIEAPEGLEGFRSR